MEAGIDCVAVTDHNSGAWIDKLELAYKAMELSRIAGFRPLHIFPGVELGVNSGFHLLALFDKGTSTGDIDTLLGAVEYTGTKGDSDGVTRKSGIQVVEAVLAAGGLPIPAHADREKGLLRLQAAPSPKAALDVQTIELILKCNGVLAMEVVDRLAPRPPVYAEHRLAWAEVLGSDCHNFRAENVPGSRFTWIKMATPSLEGLRLALLDGEGFSVRRSDDAQPFSPFEQLPEHFIEAIEISQARYMGRGQPEKLAFSPWFNALVGGRGTGKSTVVHGLRLGYRREAELKAQEAGSEARRTFDEFNKVPSGKGREGGLQEQTDLLIMLMRDGVRHRLRWRKDGTGAAVEEETSGGWVRSESQLVTPDRFPLRLFSQGQIGALAGQNQEALLAVIDEAAGSGRSKEVLEESKRRIMALRAQGRELDGRLKGREPLRVRLADVRRKLARFEEAHHAEVLKAYQTGVRQEREVERQLGAADQVIARVRVLAVELVPDDVPQGLFDSLDPDEQEALGVVERLAQAVRGLGKTLDEGAAQLQEIVRQERAELPRSAWFAALAGAKAKYAELVDTLKSQGVADPSEYGMLVQERQRLEAEDAKLDSLLHQRQQVSGQIDAQTRQVLLARHALSEQRQDFLQQALATNPYVRIALVPYGDDPRVLERSLRETLSAPDNRFEDDILTMDNDLPVKGIIAELLGVPGSTDLMHSLGFTDSVAELQVTEQRLDECKHRVEQACSGQGNFGGHFNNYLKNAFDKSPEFLDRLLTWFPEDSLRIEYSPKGDGQDFRSVAQASAGQRAAAMLAFLLAHGTEPIVLDQPEDDLDNHLIYDLVVRQIQANKSRRQIIVVTHNPNIVVNGDAEMLHLLDFRKGQCCVVERGSLQDKAMRDEVCNVMEGGREAFRRRYRRLGPEE